MMRKKEKKKERGGEAGARKVGTPDPESWAESAAMRALIGGLWAGNAATRMLIVDSWEWGILLAKLGSCSRCLGKVFLRWGYWYRRCWGAGFEMGLLVLVAIGVRTILWYVCFCCRCCSRDLVCRFDLVGLSCFGVSCLRL